MALAIAADAQVKTQTVTVSVTWTDLSDNEANFIIERCAGAGCTDFAAVGRPAANATAFVDSIANDTGNQQYQYRLIAENAAGKSPPSPPSLVRTPVILLVPNTPGGVIAVVVGVQINP
jgi:hypothetical protein